MTERETLSWSEFGVAARELAQQVVDGGYAPDVILAIARGGLIPAAAVAYALDLHNVATVNVEFYTGVEERMEVPIMLPPVLDATDIAGATLLVVDDVTDTGKTLELVKRFAVEHVAAVRTAVLYEKPQSVVKCEYVWRRTEKWVDFPWSAPDPIVS